MTHLQLLAQEIRAAIPDVQDVMFIDPQARSQWESDIPAHRPDTKLPREIEVRVVRCQHNEPRWFVAVKISTEPLSNHRFRALVVDEFARTPKP
jgi:hypothetical protein